MDVSIWSDYVFSFSPIERVSAINNEPAAIPSPIRLDLVLFNIQKYKNQALAIMKKMVVMGNRKMSCKGGKVLV